MEFTDLEYDLESSLDRLNVTKSDLNLLRKSLQNVLVPQNLSDKQLLLFYNACNFSIDKSVTVMQIYYEIRKTTHEHFSIRDPIDEKIKQCLNNQAYFVVPPIKEGGPIFVYHKLLNSIASNYMFDNAVKTYCMTIDAALYKYGPTSGIIFIHDMENVGFMHLFRANILTLRKFLNFIQNGIPAKVCQIHVFNVNTIFNRIINLIKPFLKKELLEIIFTHKSNMDYDEFYKKWIPKSHLPSDYGGELNSILNMHSEFCSDLLNLRNYFLSEEKQWKSIVA